jgi:hypothetical protein
MSRTGRPPKPLDKKSASKGGKLDKRLKEVLYVRADVELLVALDSMRMELAKQNPGMSVSRSDVARKILWEAISKAQVSKAQVSKAQSVGA